MNQLGYVKQTVVGLAAAGDDAVQRRLFDSTRHPLLLQVRYMSVRMGRMFSRRLQQRHEVLRSIIRDQCHVDQVGQQGIANFFYDLLFTRHAISLLKWRYRVTKSTPSPLPGPDDTTRLGAAGRIPGLRREISEQIPDQWGGIRETRRFHRFRDGMVIFLRP